MGGMRDRLIHDYLGVDYDVVWDVVTGRIHLLRQEIEAVLQHETDEENRRRNRGTLR